MLNLVGDIGSLFGFLQPLGAWILAGLASFNWSSVRANRLFTTLETTGVFKLTNKLKPEDYESDD